MSNELTLPAYIINLKHRPERLKDVLAEFKDKEEFKIKVVEAIEDTVGAAGLWKSMVHIVNMAILNAEDIIIICEDDHYFTEHYDKVSLFNNIREAHAQGADILCGGISGGFSYALPLTKNRFWVDGYWCNQFIIVYKKFFQKILDTEFDRSKKVDQTLSSLTSNKMVLYPFVSNQRFYGYSDVTQYNEANPEWSSNRFNMVSKRLQAIQDIYRHYYK